MCCNSHRMIRNAVEAGQYRSAKRTAAAVKGWETRRANMGQGFGIVPDPAPMTFGGTLPTGQTSVVTEVERVRSR